MMQAAFLCNRPENISRAYDNETRAALESLTALLPGVYTQDDLSALRDVECVFSSWGMPVLSERTLAEKLPRLRAVFYAAGSVQYFARPYLARGARVFSAWGANAVPVSEFAVAQIVLSGKGYFGGLRKAARGGRDAFSDFSRTLPCNYREKVGILGAGMIGRRVVSMLRGYDLETLVFDPFVSRETVEALGGRVASLAEIFSECQVISNHIANLPSTVGMLDYSLFSRMRPQTTFINTGRGAQVAEADLARALREEPGRTALLDVTWPEPPEEGSELYEMDNVILSPHIAGAMGNEVARMGAYMLEECRKYVTGAPCAWEVTEKMLDTMA